MYFSQLLFFNLYLSVRQKQTHQGKRKHEKDEIHFCRRFRVCNFVILQACVGEWWLHFFFPREKQWRVSSLMCFTSADLISRPGSSHWRQISFPRTDVMSRHWVDTGQCWGTLLTDGSHPSVLIVFVFFLFSSFPSVNTLFFCGCLTVYQERNRTGWANKWTDLSYTPHFWSVSCLFSLKIYIFVYIRIDTKCNV